MTSLETYISANESRFLHELSELLAIPSVSAWPTHAAEMTRAAEWLSTLLTRAGLEHPRVITTAGHPIVYADWLHAAGAPTVLIYGHYDVQPPDPVEAWTSPPFVATIRDERLYARGATDDKGQLFIHLKALEAHLATRHHLPINVKVLIEGEEEVGCPNLERFVRGHGELLAADAVVDSDGAMFAAGVPSISRALRGIACFEITVRGAAADVHSGTYGGVVPNAALVLADILTRLRDRDGRVTIPGFYDDVLPLEEADRTEIGRLPFDPSMLASAIGVAALTGAPEFTPLERMWARPTLDVNGLVSGFAGDGVKTIIPATAVAKLSVRLVPTQDPTRIGDLLEARLAALAREYAAGVTTCLTRHHGGKAWALPADAPPLAAAMRAMGRAFGRQPLLVREGGSNPIVSVFEEVLGAPTILFGIGVPGEHAHAPDEHLHLDNFRRGVRAAAYLYEELARGGEAPESSPNAH